MKKKTIEDIIKESKVIFGDKYDYSKTVFKTVKDKAIIICPEHGEFTVTIDNHINNKCGCPKCAKLHRYTTQEWINEAKIIHGNKYDYSKSIYKGGREKITVICHEKDEFGNEHGEFNLRASNHLSGTGCPKCGKRIQMTQNEFIAKANVVHDNKYDYSQVNYKKSNIKVKIICPEHGIFEQTPSSHLSGCGCPVCKKGVRMTNDDFISKSNYIHNNKYDYSMVEYKNARTPVAIKCPKHGIFYQTPEAHLRGCGCSKCKSSKLENIVINILKKYSIDYVYQSKILDLGNQTVDFYIPAKKLIIECQGEQHYNPIQFNVNASLQELRIELDKRKKLDKEKYKACKNKKLNMIYFTIPAYFYKKDTNVFSGFYKTKTVFTDKDELYEYIIKQPTFTDDNIYNQINKIIDNKGTIMDDYLRVDNYAIKYLEYGSDDRFGAVNFLHSQIKLGYNPIVIFPDEFNYNFNIVASKLKHIINYNNNNTKIYARNCQIKKIQNDAAKEFLTSNHIQGYASSTVHIGAFYRDELVAVMSFLNEGNNYWNLTRFASKNNYICCGLGGKLFAYFKNNYEFNEIKSFADRRWTCNPDNNLYIKLGFKKDKIEQKDYRYYNQKVDRYKRFHKFNFRKQILHKKYGLPLTMTETEMTEKLGYSKIWDCGLIKYVYKKENNN